MDSPARRGTDRDRRPRPRDRRRRNRVRLREGETPDLNDPLLLQRRPHSQHYYPHLAVPQIHGHCKPKLASGITHVQFHIELHLSFGSIAPISRCTSLDRRVALSDGAASGRLLGARPNCPHSLSLSLSLSRWIPLLAFLCVCCEIAAKRSRMMGKEENDR